MTKYIALITFLVSSAFLLWDSDGTISTQPSSEPPNFIKSFTFTAKEITAASGDPASIVGVWKPSHPSRRIESDPCPPDKNGKIDDHIFWLDKSGFSNNYAGEDSKYLLVKIDEVILSFLRDAVGGGYGYYPEIVGRGRYALCIDLGPIAIDVEIERIKKGVTLIHQEPLYEPMKAMVEIGDENHPKLNWSKIRGSADRIAIFRDYDNRVIDVPSVFDSWTDTDAPCGKTVRYWLASANSNGASRWTDEMRITTVSCEGNRAVLSFDGTIFDDKSKRFSITGNSWLEADSGYQNHHFWATNAIETDDVTAKWLLNPASSGRWEVYVYIPETATTAQATYTIDHNNQATSVTIDQGTYHNYWVSLGTFDFAGQSEEYITLSNNTGEPTGTVLVAFDAVGIKWVGEGRGAGFPPCMETIGLIVLLSALSGFSRRRVYETA